MQPSAGYYSEVLRVRLGRVCACVRGLLSGRGDGDGTGGGGGAKCAVWWWWW